MVREGDKPLLSDGGKIGLATYEAADEFIGVFDRAFLPR